MNPQFVPPIELRETLADDLAVLMEIRQHPLVAPQQYRLNRSEAATLWLARLTSDVTTSGYSWSCATIVVESTIVGHISEFHTHSKRGHSVCLGWNLHPEYWGRGIMTDVLSRHISSLFAEHKCDEIIADCFSHNERCLRLIQRLKFVPATIGLAERTLTWLLLRCSHRIVRHRIRPEEWNAPAANP